MRDNYFSMYQNIKYKECFYIAANIQAKRNLRIYSVFMLGISFISMLAWSISKSLPLLWTIIISAAQLAQALDTYLPWSEQVGNFKFLLPDLSDLLLEISNDFICIDFSDYSERKIQKLILDYNSRFQNIESKYIGNMVIHETKFIMEKASDEWQSYFYYKFPYIEELEREAKL